MPELLKKASILIKENHLVRHKIKKKYVVKGETSSCSCISDKLSTLIKKMRF
jgi:hypothetical protein